jgi:hypothetical protein
MSTELDQSGMIDALTDGIGGILGRKARSSFYKLVERLEKMPEYQSKKPPIQQHILDILALSIVYNQIVVPLESSRGFMQLAKEAGASHVRIAKHKLDDRFIMSARKCSNLFYAMLGESKIPVSLLAFATLKELIENVFLLATARGSSK